MDISARLRCLFSGRIEQRDGSYVVELPEREVQVGNLEAGGTYKIGVLDSAAAQGSESIDDSKPDSTQRLPVTEGETRDVVKEDTGEQGDGISRVERGFVVIVPDTEPNEHVEIEITDVRDNVAFAEVVDSIPRKD